MVGRCALAVAVVLLVTTAEARAAATEVAALPGGAELRLAGPVLADSGQVAFGWVDGDQTVHVRVAGGGAPDADVFQAPAPALRGNAPGQSVTQSVEVAAGAGRLAVARSARFTSDPCPHVNPPCGAPAFSESYLGEIATGPLRGPLALRSGYGPGCRPGVRDVASLAAAGQALVALETATLCPSNSYPPLRRVAVLSLRGGRPVTFATSPRITATAIAGRWIAWLAGPPVNAAPGRRATLTIADRLTRRVHERLAFPAPTSEGAIAVRIALEADGRAVLLVPGREDGGPCTPPSTLAWTSPRDPHLHRVTTGLPAGSGLALAAGRALVERGRPSASGCEEPASLVAVRLSDGGARQVAAFGPAEFAAGDIAWDGRQAAFAAIVREGSADNPTYRTSIRLAAMS